MHYVKQIIFTLRKIKRYGIGFIEVVLIFKQDEEERMWRVQQDAEVEYRKKLEVELANPNIDKLHPIRKRNSALQITGSGLRGGSMN